MTEGSSGERRLPTGTVTFLRTDVEGSMGLARRLGSSWDAMNATHLGILRTAVEARGGTPIRTEGDAMFAVFPEAGAAVLAAIDGQRALSAQAWPEGTDLRVRMGLHSGEAHLAGDDYGGFDVNRAARIASVGHGGQIILSGPTHGLVSTSLPPPIGLRDLGRHALRDIPAPEHLFQVEVPGLRSDFPALRLATTTLGNLPARLTSFVGRSHDLTELSALIETHRLITLTGPGGIGKTSLAIELARDRADAMPDGAWFVPLDAVPEPAQVGAAIARTLGLFDGVERPAADALPGFLGERSLVLVIDNFEHLLDAAPEVARLIRASPESRFVITSRAPLRIGGEQEYPVRPLPTGGLTSPDLATLDASSRLFVDRARAVRPGWEPDAGGSVVADICRLLDGLPLGIELAAARISLLPATTIRDRLTARLPLPGAGPRDAPARQRTLEGTIAWSHDLLDPLDRAVLHALAVFEGGFDAEQAGYVVAGPGAKPGGADDVLDRLVTLAENSLIMRDPRPVPIPAGATTSGIRFGLLRTVQGFALDRLVEGGRDARTRRRHADAFAVLAEGAAPHLHAAGQGDWIDLLERDDANLRAALRWSIEAGEVLIAFRLFASLWRFWQLNGHLAEGKVWSDAIFAMPGADLPGPERLAALAAAGGIAYWRAERQESLELYHAQLALAEQLEDPGATADAWFNLSAADFIAGDQAGSRQCLTEARRRYVQLGDEVGANRADLGLANLIWEDEGLAVALSIMSRVYDRAIDLGDKPYEILASGSLAWFSFMAGDIAQAARWGVLTLVGNYRVRDLGSTTIGLPIAAVLALEAGRPEDAAVILGAFDGLCERYGVRPPLGLAEIIRQAGPLERARAVLDPDVMAAALERGRRMSLDDVMVIVEALAPPE